MIQDKDSALMLPLLVMMLNHYGDVDSVGGVDKCEGKDRRTRFCIW